MCECEGFKRTCHNTMIIEKSLVWSERERESGENREKLK